MKRVQIKRNQAPISVWQNPVHFIAFGFGLGACPYAPGTVGSLLGVLLAWLMADLPLWVYLVLLGLLCCVGIAVCGQTAHDLKTHDHAGIVIDEVVGYLITMISVPVHIGTLLLGFVVFRFFDVLKPGPIRWVDQHVGGGLGIMLDDVVAGVFGLLVMHLIVWFYL